MYICFYGRVVNVAISDPRRYFFAKASFLFSFFRIKEYKIDFVYSDQGDSTTTTYIQQPAHKKDQKADTQTVKRRKLNWGDYVFAGFRTSKAQQHS